MSIKSICKFNEISLTKEKPLIICDIDYTILHHDVKIEKFVNILKDNNLSFDDEKEMLILAREMMHKYCHIFPPIHTDFDGFNALLDNVKFLNGEIIFLTSRDCSSEEYTSKQFDHLGLKYDNYGIYYTNNKISKGEYIKLNIDISRWGEIIFIDDLDFNLKSVFETIEDVKCYKFVIH